MHVVIRPEKAFEFPILAEKTSLNFGEDLFFLRLPDFGLKKRLNFRTFREIPSQCSDKPCDSDSRTMKIRVKVVCTFLTLSKKPPPFWLRACGFTLEAKQRKAKVGNLRDLLSVETFCKLSMTSNFDCSASSVNASLFFCHKTGKMLAALKEEENC